MSYKAEVFNVMIASPGDVAAERAIVRDVVYEWNAVHSKSKNMVLLPIGWETHSSPEMGSHPQNIINRQVLDKCDLLVGVFWTRLGTPTDDYKSGTVEEIERHIEAGKPAMLYFSSKPAAPDSTVPEELSELRKFRESCQNRGLYKKYDDLTGFKDMFYRDLQLKVNEHKLFTSHHQNINEPSVIVESKTPLPIKEANNRERLVFAKTGYEHGKRMYNRDI